MDPFNLITGFGGLVGYGVVLVLLLLCGFGVPVPEDIILVSGGYLAYHEGHGVLPMIVVGLAGILGGDTILFGLGYRFGLSIAQRTFLRRYLTPARLARADALFRRHGHKMILAARYMPGVRSVTFFSSGTIGVPYWKFLLFDGLAALVSAPLWVILGYRYGPAVVDRARHFQSLVLGALALFLLAYLGWTWAASRRALARRPSPEALPPPPIAFDEQEHSQEASAHARAR